MLLWASCEGVVPILVHVVLSGSGSPTFLLCQVLFPVLGSMVSLFYLLVTSKQQNIVRWFYCKEFRQIFICSCIGAWVILFSSLTGKKWQLLLLLFV